MKQQSPAKGRILGRRVARVMTREQFESDTGPVQSPSRTFTLTDPPDRDRPDADL
jgi:hypothetical protein